MSNNDPNLFSLSLLAISEEDSHDDELKDATEDRDHTNKHPDVQE